MKQIIIDKGSQFVNPNIAIEVKGVSVFVDSVGVFVDDTIIETHIEFTVDKIGITPRPKVEHKEFGLAQFIEFLNEHGFKLEGEMV